MNEILGEPKNEPKAHLETVLIKIKDCQYHSSEPKFRNPTFRNIYCRVPPDWTENNELKYDYLEKIFASVEKIFASVYEPNRQTVNAEDWIYYMSGFYSRVLSPELVKRAVWNDLVINKEGFTLFFIASENEEIKRVPVNEFQTQIDSSRQIAAPENSFKTDSPVLFSETTFATLLISFRDGRMSAPSGGFFTPSAAFLNNYFCHVPGSWIEGRHLQDIYLEKIYEKIYGQDWRLGNSDGSLLSVQNFNSVVFSPAKAKKIKWSITEDNQVSHFGFYIASEKSEINQVSAAEFQAAVDFAFHGEKQTLPENPAELETFSLLNLDNPARLIDLLQYFDCLETVSLVKLSLYDPARLTGLLFDSEGCDAKIFSEYLRNFIVRRLGEAGLKWPLNRSHGRDEGWSSTCSHLSCDGLYDFAINDEHAPVIKDIFKEMVDFCLLLPNDNMGRRIAAMLEIYLDDFVLPARIIALLPDRAQAELPAMQKVFDEWKDAAARDEEEYFRMGMIYG